MEPPEPPERNRSDIRPGWIFFLAIGTTMHVHSTIVVRTYFIYLIEQSPYYLPTFSTHALVPVPVPDPASSRGISQAIRPDHFFWSGSSSTIYVLGVLRLRECCVAIYFWSLSLPCMLSPASLHAADIASLLLSSFSISFSETSGKKY